MHSSKLTVQPCTTGDTRLIRGDTSNEGTIEICINGVWGTICDDLWDNREAQVACRDLGYQAEGTLSNQYPYSNIPLFLTGTLTRLLITVIYFHAGAVAVRGAFFGTGGGDIQLTNFGCQGNEEKLINCSSTTPQNCFHFEDAGVICPPGIYTQTITLAILDVAI